MKKVIGIVRNECGTIIKLVLFDLDSEEKYALDPCKDAETKYGSYPVYDEELNLIGNKGLIILEKTDDNVKVMTCSGYYVPEGNEDAIIAKTSRLNMRIVNASVLTDQNGNQFICTL